MARTGSHLDGKRKAAIPTLWIGRGLLLLWAGFWLWFNLASGISEMPVHGWGALAGHLVTAGVMTGFGVLAWLYPRVGGLGLFLLAGAMAWFFHPTLAVAAILVLPPVVIGTLLLLARRGSTAPLTPA